MAENEWILEVLEGITEFAGKNGLPQIRAALLGIECIVYAELKIEKTNVHYLHRAGVGLRRV